MSTFGTGVWSTVNASAGTSFNYALISLTSRASVVTRTRLVAIGRWY
jgi:hypothetical protein